MTCAVPEEHEAHTNTRVKRTVCYKFTEEVQKNLRSRILDLDSLPFTKSEMRMHLKILHDNHTHTHRNNVVCASKQLRDN